jgi:hypothetical protein
MLEAFHTGRLSSADRMRQTARYMDAYIDSEYACCEVSRAQWASGAAENIPVSVGQPDTQATANQRGYTLRFATRSLCD